MYVSCFVNKVYRGFWAVEVVLVYCSCESNEYRGRLAIPRCNTDRKTVEIRAVPQCIAQYLGALMWKRGLDKLWSWY